MSPSLARITPLLLALASAPGAQAPWAKQAPIPVGGTVSSLAVLSPTELWCTADLEAFGDTALVHTDDGGLSWDLTPIQNGAVDAVFFVDPQHGWAAGNGMFHTTDGGATWVKDNSWGSMSDLFFLDTSIGWACGNGSMTYRTTDGGLTWAFTGTPSNHTMTSIWFVDPLNGWCVNIGGEVYRSTDGGQSWTLSIDANTYLAAVQFFDAQEGWAIGGNTFLRTTDGGLNWTPATVPAGTWVHRARFADKQNGIAVGQEGNIVRTVDGGQTWTTIQPASGDMLLWDVEFPDKSVAFYGGLSGSLARSLDQGLTWTSLQSGGSGVANSLDLVDDKHAWAASDSGSALVTSDGGVLWERRVVDGFLTGEQLADVDFADANTGWAVGNERISRSTDGGLTWQLQYQQIGGPGDAVFAVDPLTAFVVGDKTPDSVLRTTDGGLTWSAVSPPQGNFRDVFFLDGSTGWVAGSHVYRTNDGGQSWSLQYTASGAPVEAIEFADPQNGWLVGPGGLVLRTGNGGLSWVAQNAGAPSNATLLDVSVVDANTAWVGGWSGFLAYTTNRGITWTQETVPGAANASFRGVAFIDAERGWVGGSGGVWRRGGTPYSLTATPPLVSLASGGTQSFALDAGTDWGGDLYLLLGSASGTSPGFPVDSVVVPLNPSDLWFVYTLLHANQAPLSQSLGLLDGEGKASASLTLPAGSPAELAGLTLHHAFVVLDLSALNHASFASNPVSLMLVP